MYTLYIANKNYSSWSLRPWLLMMQLEIKFKEVVVAFKQGPGGILKISPSGKLPCLHHGQRVIWDSLAIIEYLAERHPGVWPSNEGARAWARSASAEMHSGFTQLREICSMDCGLRIKLHQSSLAALRHDLDRLEKLWAQGLTHFGGPWLTGQDFCAVDAFYAPVALRAKTYGLKFSPESRSYIEHLLALRNLRAWEAAALKEPWRELEHERQALAAGTLLEDLRKRQNG